ncbi:unnamed protein product, partial [Effrenium voratum]
KIEGFGRCACERCLQLLNIELVKLGGDVLPRALRRETERVWRPALALGLLVLEKCCLSCEFFLDVPISRALLSCKVSIGYCTHHFKFPLNLHTCLLQDWLEFVEAPRCPDVGRVREGIWIWPSRRARGESLLHPLQSHRVDPCSTCAVGLCVLDDQSTTEWKTYVTQKFTWLYILSQDYWIVFLVPLVYYYGEMKLGKD